MDQRLTNYIKTLDKIDAYPFENELSEYFYDEQNRGGCYYSDLCFGNDIEIDYEVNQFRCIVSVYDSNSSNELESFDFDLNKEDKLSLTSLENRILDLTQEKINHGK